MHKPALALLVHKRLFPNPRPNDPTSFAAHITRHLVPEVRIETATFYGALDCIEAQYPGLDYSHPPHRMRLSRFPWHRRLFRVFDEMKLTETEISSLCHWEGTKWARERYEKDNGVKVKDTTGDDIQESKPTGPPNSVLHVPYAFSGSISQGSPERTTRGRAHAQEAVRLNAAAEDIPDEEEEDESEEEISSIGLELNRRLLAATETTDSGHAVSMDPDFEQWLKEATERGSYDVVGGEAYPMPSNVSNATPASGLLPQYQVDNPASSAVRPERVSSAISVPAETVIGAAAIRRSAETAR